MNVKKEHEMTITQSVVVLCRSILVIRCFFHFLCCIRCLLCVTFLLILISSVSHFFSDSHPSFGRLRGWDDFLLLSSNDIVHKFLFCSVIGCHFFRVPGHKDSNKFQCSTLYIAAFLLCAHRHVCFAACLLLPGILYISCSLLPYLSFACYLLILIAYSFLTRRSACSVLLLMPLLSRSASCFLLSSFVPVATATSAMFIFLLLLLFAKSVTAAFVFYTHIHDRIFLLAKFLLVRFVVDCCYHFAFWFPSLLLVQFLLLRSISNLFYSQIYFSVPISIAAIIFWLVEIFLAPAILSIFCSFLLHSLACCPCRVLLFFVRFSCCFYCFLFISSLFYLFCILPVVRSCRFHFSHLFAVMLANFLACSCLRSAAAFQTLCIFYC